MKPSSMANGKPPVLIIDDDPHRCELFAQLLEQEQLDTICCHTGQAALESCRQQEPEVVILDLQLSDIDGLHLLGQLKAENPTIKVVVHTRHASLDTAVAAVNDGAFAYVAEPDNPTTIVEHVQRAYQLQLIWEKKALEREVAKQTRALRETNERLKQEIRERQQAEAALHKQKTEFEAIFKAMPEAVVFTDADRQIVQSNPALTTLFGYEPEEVLGQQTEILYADAEDYEAQGRIRFNERAQEKLDPYEVTYRRKDGERFISETIGTVVKDPNGKLLGYLGIIRDITARKQAEVARERRAQEMAALYKTSLEINRHLDLSALLQAIVRRACRLLDAQMGAILLGQPDGETLELVVGHQLGAKYLGVSVPLGEGLAGRVAQQGEPKIVSNYRHWDGKIGPWQEIIGRILGVPFKQGNTIMGVLTVFDEYEGTFSQEETRLLSLVAAQAATAIENAQLYQEMQASLAKSEALYQVTRSVIAFRTLPKVLQAVVDSVAKALSADCVVIYTVNLERQLVLHQVQGGPGAERVPLASFEELWAGLSGWALREKKPVLSSKESPDSRESPEVQIRRAKLDNGSIMVVPLRYWDQVQGTITAINRADQPDFTPQDLELLEAMGNQVAVAIENVRLFDQTYRWAQQLATLNELARELSGLLDVSVLCTTVVKRLGVIFYHVNTAVYLLDSVTGELNLEAVAGEDINQFEVGGQRLVPVLDFVKRSATTGETVLAKDTWGQLDLGNQGELALRSVLATPLRAADHIRGVLVVASKQPDAFDEGDVTVTTTVADQLAVALSKALLFRNVQQHAEQLEALHQVSQDLGALRDVDMLLKQIVERATWLLDDDIGGIYLYRPEDDQLEWVVALGKHVPPPGITLDRGEGIAGKVWVSGKPLRVDDYQSWSGQSLQWTEVPVSAAIGVPIHWGGEFLGVLIQGNRDRRSYTDEDARLLSQFAAQAAIAIRNVRFYVEIEQRLKEKTALQEAGAVISATLDLEVVLNHVAEQMGRVVDATSAYICSFESESMTTTVLAEYFSPEASSEERVSDLGTIYKLQQDFPSTVEVLQSGQPGVIHIDDPDLSETERRHLQQFGAKSALTIPMQVGDRTIADAMLWESRRRREFTVEEINLCQSIAQQAAIALEQARLHQQIQTQAKQLQQLIDTVPEGILLLDIEHRVRLANPVASSYLALLADVSTDQVLRLGDDALDEILNLTGEKPWYEVQHAESGVFEVAAQPIEMETGIDGWVMLLRDVTEERALQEQVRQQDRLAVVGQLAAGIAHDFNNILMSIIGFAELAQARPDLPVGISDNLRQVMQQSQRAADLVRQILDFSRRSMIQKQPLALAPFLHETVEILARTLPETIQLSLKVEPGSANINADQTQIQQLLINLALNARDAMPEGGILEIRLSQLSLEPGDPLPSPEMEPGQWEVLTVSDTGIGIQAEDLPHIFEPFFTTKEVGQGTGLGLAQAYGIVKQHGGEINVDSKPGQGTTFTLYFPVQFPETREPSFQPTQSDFVQGQGEVILLVEDEPLVLDIVATMLELLDYRVRTAINGLEALTVYDQYAEEIALVLTDMTMPGMGGVELFKRLRKKNSAVKVIVLTGYPLETEALLAQGIVDLIQKPVVLKELAQSIGQAIGV